MLRFISVFRDAIDFHAAEDIEFHLRNPRSNLREDFAEQQFKPSKGRARVESGVSVSTRQWRNQFSRKPIPRRYDLVRRQAEVPNKGLPMPLTDTEDQIDVVLNSRVLEIV